MFQKKNIVIFAAGGGNDIFSALAYAKCYLTDYQFDQIAIVGALGFTPFHSNTSIKPDFINVEEPLIKPTTDFKRYLMFHPPREIYNNERLFPDILTTLEASTTESQRGINIKHYTCMSPKYSALEQAVNLRKLFIEWNMTPENTMLNIVDFGGDILTNGLQSSIISPGLDAYTLAVVGNLSKEQVKQVITSSAGSTSSTSNTGNGNSTVTVKGYLSKVSVCFPGVDGELPMHYLTSYCQKYSIKKDMIDASKWQSTLTSIHEVLKKGRSGNTIPNMISVLKNINLEQWQKTKVSVSKHWTIGKNTTKIEIVADINYDLQPFIWMFNIEPLLTSNPFVKVFNIPNYELTDVIQNILQIYKGQVKSAYSVQSSDLHLQYLRNDLYGKWSNKQLLYPSNSKEKPIQEVMIIDVLPVLTATDSDKIVKELSNISTLYDTRYTSKTFPIKK